MASRADRRVYFVDKKVQGALLARAARYWLLSVVIVATLTVLGWMFVTPGIGALIQLREHLSWLLGGLFVALVASLSVLPVILYDLAKTSNRFVGPVLRLRRAMNEAAAGEHVEPIHFRDHDYWQEFADAFNLLNHRLQQLENKGEEAEFGELTSVN